MGAFPAAIPGIRKKRCNGRCLFARSGSCNFSLTEYGNCLSSNEACCLKIQGEKELLVGEGVCHSKFSFLAIQAGFQTIGAMVINTRNIKEPSESCLNGVIIRGLPSCGQAQPLQSNGLLLWVLA